jgi:2-methylcitrate dehydratase PrpD
MRERRLSRASEASRGVSRRKLLQSTGALLATAAFRPQFAGEVAEAAEVSDVMTTLSTFMAGAATRPLPEPIVEKTKFMILDTLAAMISGSELPPGKFAIQFVRPYSGNPICTVAGSSMRCGPMEAALANGILAHSDETDDTHPPSQSHPGCAAIPAALAVGERFGIDGTRFVRSVALGYDVGTRITATLGKLQYMFETHRSTHGIAGTWVAAAAAGCAAGLDAQQMRWLLSYTAQQASGLASWQRDIDHIEKAFDFGGMGARNGVAGAMMVAAGMSGVDDPFDGRGNFFEGFALKPHPEVLSHELGKRYEIMEASIKKWCVGSPIQSVLDATTALIDAHKIRPDAVKRIAITMPDDRMHIVNNRDIPDICVQYLTALAIVDGTVGFAAAHDEARMTDKAVQAVRDRIELIPSPELSAAVPARQAIVEIDLADGRTVRHHAKAVRGTPDNPMTTKEIDDEAIDLMAPIIGEDRASKLVAAVRTLEQLRSVRDLRPLLQA